MLKNIIALSLISTLLSSVAFAKGGERQPLGAKETTSTTIVCVPTYSLGLTITGKGLRLKMVESVTCEDGGFSVPTAKNTSEANSVRREMKSK